MTLAIKVPCVIFGVVNKYHLKHMYRIPKYNFIPSFIENHITKHQHSVYNTAQLTGGFGPDYALNHTLFD